MTIDDEGFVGRGHDAEVRHAVTARQGGVVGTFVLDKSGRLDGFLEVEARGGQGRGDGSDVGVLIVPETLELVQAEVVVHVGRDALAAGRFIVVAWWCLLLLDLGGAGGGGRGGEGGGGGEGAAVGEVAAGLGGVGGGRVVGP